MIVINVYGKKYKSFINKIYCTVKNVTGLLVKRKNYYPREMSGIE